MTTKVLTLRLEEDAWREVQAFQHIHGLDTPTQAIRVLIEVGSRDARTVEEAFRRACWREGVRKASKRVRDEMDAAVARALGAE